MCVKQRRVCEKDSIWNTTTRSRENGIYLASIMDDSAIMCDRDIRRRSKF